MRNDYVFWTSRCGVSHPTRSPASPSFCFRPKSRGCTIVFCLGRCASWFFDSLRIDFPDSGVSSRLQLVIESVTFSEFSQPDAPDLRFGPSGSNRAVGRGRTPRRRSILQTEDPQLGGLRLTGRNSSCFFGAAFDSQRGASFRYTLHVRRIIVYRGLRPTGRNWLRSQNRFRSSTIRFGRVKELPDVLRAG